ncbi:Aminoacyl tRNA synthase complex-interacting multifunctional protein 1 [Eumeta japonica]|uniref:Aminoacyl tRNA synthase complex-interacting multifunctional protein 1 n=1 Tax=Eumeta variegata TaxID=151549 RepID=A0A4C1ZMI2_EUMVA|nr:Aminoacyl tRNA synthase complex-interacting multifunctional protein 1 [Eumeta japonica]
MKIEEKIKELSHENLMLSEKVGRAKNELINLETLNGKKQYYIPGKDILPKDNLVVEGATIGNVNTPTKEMNKGDKAKEVIKKNKGKTNDNVGASDAVIDVRKLDFRIGKIVEINKHPDADTLYVEKIDCGEGKPRTVVSGLVNHVPITEMQNRVVMVLCNLKPVQMRGITSEAMVMCASSPEKVEVLIPPVGAIPGDLVICKGYPREPELQLNPKKKIFETCAPDLKTNDNLEACYKNCPLFVENKGPILAATLKGVPVK